MKEIKIHPLAEIMPEMNDLEKSALKADLDANGQREDITLYEGQVLDGRHRYNALRELGRKPRFRTFKGSYKEAVEFIYSQSLHRNMNAGQQACVAVKLDLAATESGKDRKLQNLQKKQGSVDPAKISGSTPDSRDLVGSRYGISGRYISYAKLLYLNDSKLFEQVRMGFEPLARAVRSYQRSAKAQAHKKKLEIVRRSVDPGQIDIRTGDCRTLADEVPSHSARLIFCDPQYNIGYDYGKKSIDDSLDANDYLEFSTEWIEQAHRILTADGSLWVLICDEWAAEYAIMLKKAGFVIRNWIKWWESFGVNCSGKFNRTSRHLFYCIKDSEKFVFNDWAVLVASSRQIKHHDKRANPDGKIWDDVWGIDPKNPIARLVDNSPERIPGIPTQLPLALLRPIVSVATEPGDLVMDFFTGSGTTAHACVELHRRFIGFEKNKDFAQIARDRIVRITIEQKE